MYVITDQGDHEKTISVLLNGVESTVEFLDGIEIQVHTDSWKQDHIKAINQKAIRTASYRHILISIPYEVKLNQMA